MLKRHFIAIFLAVDAALIAIFAHSSVKLLNSQIAFICAFLILLASFLAHKKQVLAKSSAHKLNEDEMRFFDDNSVATSRHKLKLKELSFAALFSPIRLISYAFLILAFFILKRHNVFEPLAFLFGLAAMPIAAMMCALIAAILQRRADASN